MRIASLGIALILDALLGDPRHLPHPVVLMGKAITRVINFVESQERNQSYKRNAGLILSVSLVVVSFGFSAALIYLAGLIHPILAFALETYLIYQCLAAHELYRQSMAVYQALKSGNLAQARTQLSHIVGRDTEQLKENEIIKASIETVAENTNDAVISPLIFAAIGGAPLALAYKAINTLDSMIGYKNERFLELGNYAARIDDLASWAGARISGLALIIASWVLKLDTSLAWKIFKRDRLAHASPNSGHPEAAVAGALNLELGGNHTYQGKLFVKPTIGDDIRNARSEDIKLTNKLMVVSTCISFATLALIFALGGALIE